MRPKRPCRFGPVWLPPSWKRPGQAKKNRRGPRLSIQFHPAKRAAQGMERTFSTTWLHSSTKAREKEREREEHDTRPHTLLHMPLVCASSPFAPVCARRCSPLQAAPALRERASTRADPLEKSVKHAPIFARASAADSPFRRGSAEGAHVRLEQLGTVVKVTRGHRHFQRTERREKKVRLKSGVSQTHVVPTAIPRTLVFKMAATLPNLT